MCKRGMTPHTKRAIGMATNGKQEMGSSNTVSLTFRTGEAYLQVVVEGSSFGLVPTGCSFGNLP